MIGQFILAPTDERAALAVVEDKAGWKGTQPIELGSYTLVHGASEQEAAGAVVKTRDHSVVVIGEFHNREVMRALLAVYDTSALSAGDAQLLALALEHLGDASLALFEGPFVCIVADTRQGTLSLLSDPTAQMSAYVSHARRQCFASQLKLVCARDDFKPAFAPVETILATDARADDFCPVLNVQRLKPGVRLSVVLDGAAAPHLEQRLLHRFRPEAERFVATAQAQRLVRDALESAVRCRAEAAGRVGVPLSGGVDSSLVLALAARSVPELASFSVGTELSNEFEYAEMVAKHVGTRHTSLLLSGAEIMRGVVEAIQGNEIFDGYASEVQAALFALYRRITGEVDTLLTGYGADLLFGGILPFQAPSRAANLRLWEQVYRTRWTGELSPAGGSRFRLNVRHPFWSTRLIGLCLDLDASLKVSEQDVKLLLKRFAAEGGLVPHRIITRKKIGIHEGSSANRVFSEFLGASEPAHVEKTKFSYFVYRRHLQAPTALEFDPIELRGRYRSEES